MHAHCKLLITDEGFLVVRIMQLNSDIFPTQNSEKLKWRLQYTFFFGNTPVTYKSLKKYRVL